MEMIFFGFIVIFGASSFLGTIFLTLKQPIIIAYILGGIIFGPYVLNVVGDFHSLEIFSHLGIIFLLFLIGLNLHPELLKKTVKKTFFVTIGSCGVIFASIFLIFNLLNFSLFDSTIIGLALMFSSTVVGVKLIPTTALHHKHIGEVMISVLLLQDIIAILILVLNETGFNGFSVLFVFLKLFSLSMLGYFFVKYFILKFMAMYDTIQDYIFVVAIGWCFIVAGIAHYIGLSYEIGAFIAGVTLSISPVSLVISENLKVLREFFLIIFFFSVGAQLDIFSAYENFIYVFILLIAIFFVKPVLFYWMMRINKESKVFAKEVAVRLSQGSEFALLLVFVVQGRLTSAQTGHIIRAAIIISFIISTYITTKLFETPISTEKELLRD